ncbi:hypothetical protein H0H92_015146 [Tricholoma furcatifolium]|nr:hypothetical protein H0H92_015146 [Tricholoma furcatifolium]
MVPDDRRFASELLSNVHVIVMSSSSPTTDSTDGDPGCQFEFFASSSPHSHPHPLSSSSPGSYSDSSVTTTNTASTSEPELIEDACCFDSKSTEVSVNAQDHEQPPGKQEENPTESDSGAPELSPLVFASRVIHRASSYRRPLVPSSVAGHGPAADSEPPLKRPKLLTRTYTHTTLRTRLARAPASLRRAASLRAPTSSSWDKENLAPTLPSSPALVKVVGVPIIAPPYPLPLGGPTDREAQARARLRRFVEREKDLRVVEGYKHDEGEGGWAWEVIGDELREQVVRWFLEVDAPAEQTNDGVVGNRIGRTSPVSSTTSSHSQSQSQSESTSTSTSTFTLTSTSTSTSTPNTTHTLSAASSPAPHPGPTPSNLHCQLSTSPETRFHAAYLFLRFFRAVERGNLSMETTTSTQCQWAHELDAHGKLLVTWDLALACLAISVKYHRDFLDPLLPVYAWEFMRLETGLQARMQHAGVSIETHETDLSLGPTQILIGYNDLETAHRDLLAALDFRLGDTPQGVLNEAWEAMPALRAVVRGPGSAVGVGALENERDGAREGQLEPGWNFVLKETWRALFRAVRGPTILAHPLSALTAAALLHGVCALLVMRYEDAVPWYACPYSSPYSYSSGCGEGMAGASRERGRGGRVEKVERQERVERAERELTDSGVLAEVGRVLGIGELLPLTHMAHTGTPRAVPGVVEAHLWVCGRVYGFRGGVWVKVRA